MQSGIVLYSKNVRAMCRFYEKVFELTVQEQDESYALLSDRNFELVLLETADSQSVTENGPRESTPIKHVFFVESHYELFANTITQYGGTLYPLKKWQFRGRQVCDGVDCEGNIFQLRILPIVK